MRAELNAPLHTGAPVVVQTTTHTVHVKETAKVDEHHHEETDFYYTKERVSYINLIRNLGFIAILVSIASIVLASIHVSRVGRPDFVIILLIAACIFFIGSIFAVFWATKAGKAFKAHSDLFQPQLNENLTRTVFILGLLLAGGAAFVVTHLFVEFNYSPDFATARELDTVGFFKTNFIVQSALAGFLFFFFLLTARAAFNCLKFGNQAMSHLVFLGCFLLFAFSLAIIFFGDTVLSQYGLVNKSILVATVPPSPQWVSRGLFFVGIVLAAVSVTGFFVTHKSWRVGFFVLAFLVLVSLVFLITFTGFSYRATSATYAAYKTEANCLKVMKNLNKASLEDYGCPAKYTSGNCAVTDPLRTATWETNANEFGCLNPACCGIQGQLYSKRLIQLSAFGLLATLAAALVSIGCYYFWYVTWVDTARDKKRDFVWLGLMGVTLLVFIILISTLNIDIISERAQ